MLYSAGNVLSNLELFIHSLLLKSKYKNHKIQSKQSNKAQFPEGKYFSAHKLVLSTSKIQDKDWIDCVLSFCSTVE